MQSLQLLRLWTSLSQVPICDPSRGVRSCAAHSGNSHYSTNCQSDIRTLKHWWIATVLPPDPLTITHQMRKIKINSFPICGCELTAYHLHVNRPIHDSDGVVTSKFSAGRGNWPFGYFGLFRKSHTESTRSYHDKSCCKVLVQWSACCTDKPGFTFSKNKDGLRICDPSNGETRKIE